MKVKTAELRGAALDYAVAVANGLDVKGVAECCEDYDGDWVLMKLMRDI